MSCHFVLIVYFGIVSSILDDYAMAMNQYNTSYIIRSKLYINNNMIRDKSQ